MVNDITVVQSIEKIFQSKRDRIRNADFPDQMRPKQDRKPLKGIARQLYLDKKVKLSNAEALVSSDKGLALKKPTPDESRRRKK